MQPFEQNRTTFGAGAVRTEAQIDQGLRSFMLGVYNNMVLGLAISALVALGLNILSVASPGQSATVLSKALPIPLTAFGAMIYKTPLMFVLAFSPFVFMLILGSRFSQMSAASARTTFLLFSAAMGASLSTILLAYTAASVVQVFFITATAFGSLSLWGYTTNRSLTGMGSFLMMGLIGIIIASVVNFFLASGVMQTMISIFGVLIFAGLTAFRTQSLKEMYLYGNFDSETVAKVSIFGALDLYLYFINMFLMLLSLLGNNRNE